MRIVHINDCAFVGASLVKELRARGYEVGHITRSRSLFSKTFGIGWKILRSGDADIYHVHYALQDAFLTRLLKRLDVLHCHGSDLRWKIHGRWGRVIKSNLRKARKVIVSTSDILSRASEFNDSAEYLPNPIDTEIFKPRTKKRAEGKPRALYLEKWYEKLPPSLEESLEKYGFFLDKVKGKPHAYEDMPKVFSKYDVFIDQLTIDSLSKTCLEAMGCGLSCVTYLDKEHFGDVVERLSDPVVRTAQGRRNRRYILERHDVRKVVDRLTTIYKEVKS